MAARQDQTLQIFLIIFIFLFLVTAVFAYLGWRGYSDSDQKATQLQNSLNEKSQQMQTQTADLEDLKALVGFGRPDSMDSVKKAAAEDMKNFGEAVADEPSRTYRKVLETVYTEGKKAEARILTLNDKLGERDKALAAVQAQTSQQIKQHADAQAKAEADAAAERNSFADFREQLKKSQAELQKSLDDQRTKYEAQIADRDKTIKDLTDNKAKLEHAVANLIENRKDEPESFEVADGRISAVNQDGTVWINLGSADFLRRQVTFSVFDADLHDAEKSKKKASIEVTRSWRPHGGSPDHERRSEEPDPHGRQYL